MIRKILLAIFVVVLIISSSFVSAIKDYKITNQNALISVNLTDENLEKINNIINSLEDNETKKIVKEIFNQIITGDNNIDFESCKNFSQEFFKSISEKIVGGSYNLSKTIFQNEFSMNASKSNVSVGIATGTSTVFEPPYDSCFSWGHGTFGIDEFSHGCNKYSGAVGAYSNAWIGGATAEAMQQLNFYVGRIKNVDVNIKIIRTGGKTTFGFGAFAGTEKTWSWDDFQNNYHRADVDPWWTWDLIILKIISLISIMVGFAPETIAEAISLLDTIIDFEAFLLQMEDMLDDNDAEILNIRFSFTANPGYHSIWAGLRSTASACITGTGSAVTLGQISKITIDGIACPDAPNIDGPSDGKVNDTIIFGGESHDPNLDNIRYFFDWGDGSNSGWTEFIPSGIKIYRSHKYSDKGSYTIKLIAEDIDKMKVETLKMIIINSENYQSFNSELFKLT